MFSISNEESVLLGNTVYYRGSNGIMYIEPYKEVIFPVYTGTGGTYSGLTTLGFEYQTNARNERIDKTIGIFITTACR